MSRLHRGISPFDSRRAWRFHTLYIANPNFARATWARLGWGFNCGAQYCESVIRHTQLIHGKLPLFITSQNLLSAIVRPLRSPAVHLQIQGASRPAEGEDEMLVVCLGLIPNVLIPGQKLV